MRGGGGNCFRYRKIGTDNDRIPQSLPEYGGSWDLLELDLEFHEVNLDPSYDTDVEECVFLGDDPFGVLPTRPTPPDSLDL